MKTRCLLVLSALLLLIEARAFAFYDSGTGRWLSKDPVEEVGGINLYAMVSNNPLNFVDNLGLASIGGLRLDTDNCLYIWITVLQGGNKTLPARPSHTGIGSRPWDSTGPVALSSTRQEGDWKRDGTYDPNTGKWNGGSQGKLYECCCLSSVDYAMLQLHLVQIQNQIIPEGSKGAGGPLNTGTGMFGLGAATSSNGQPYNCATATSMVSHGLGGLSGSNIADMSPSTMAPPAPGDSPFFRTVMEQYKQMEAAVKAKKCKIVHNGVPPGNPY